MTKAMKLLLQRLCGHLSAGGSVAHPPAQFALLVNAADMKAAADLAKLGIVRIEGSKAYLWMETLPRQPLHPTPSSNGSDRP